MNFNLFYDVRLRGTYYSLFIIFCIEFLYNYIKKFFKFFFYKKITTTIIIIFFLIRRGLTPVCNNVAKELTFTSLPITINKLINKSLGYNFTHKLKQPLFLQPNEPHSLNIISLVFLQPSHFVIFIKASNTNAQNPIKIFTKNRLIN